MANQEHLDILKQGVEVWNDWRKENRKLIPDLCDVILRKAKLGNSDLSRTNLSRSDLSRADLRGADLRGANLYRANLQGADLHGADLRNSSFRSAALCGTNLSVVYLGHMDLQDVDLTNAKIGLTDFVNNDLSSTRGLETIRHKGPSSVGIDTIYKSGGNIPEAFLRGCGVPDTFITFAKSLVGKAIDYYSAFISYSSRNTDIAERLYADLQNKGVRCWFAPEDMKIGDKLRPRIDETIRIHDKLLLVLSAESVASQWVEQEVETALDKERDHGRTVLFPIRLDDSIMEIKTGWPALIKNTRHIGDFSRWKDHDSYSEAFERLLRDLKAETVVR